MSVQFELDSLRSAFAGRLLSGPAEMEPFLLDWRRRWRGRARCVVQPETAAEVANVLRWCAERRVPVVPQGGNTSLSGGSVPDESGESIVLSLARLNRIRGVDARNSTLVAEAGCVLAHVQQSAVDASRLFPLSLAAEGSCTIGGGLATNAGGTAVLRYGNARDLCLGLEVVTADGTMWDGLKGLRKDNSGYDLRDLFIGSEGTLGVITAATLKLFPLPAGRAVALAATGSVEAATELLEVARRQLDTQLTAFELMSAACVRLVGAFLPRLDPGLDSGPRWYVLLEATDTRSHERAAIALGELLEAALEAGIVTNGVLADSLAQAQSLWALRENIPESQGRLGPAIKHDISLPISRIAEFVERTDGEIASRWPQLRPFTFGHLGDGNLHYNFSPAEGVGHAAFEALEQDVNRVVHDAVHAANGSISAEHGLGVLRRDEAKRYKSAVEIELQRRIKQAFDPLGILNPGKVLASR